MQIVCRRTVGVDTMPCALCSMFPHRAGKFKSSVILCDMKQVCELSEDAARRVMSSTCSVSTSRSLAGLGRSSGQCGLPSLHARTPAPFQPEHRYTQQDTATTQSPAAQPIRKLSPPYICKLRATLGLPRVTRNIFPGTFFGVVRSLGRCAGWPWRPPVGQYQPRVSLIKRPAAAP